MKLLILSIALAAAVWCVASGASLMFDDELDSFWLQFKMAHAKRYESVEHELERRLIWEENLALIRQHNREESTGKHTYRLGMNQYGDMRSDELARLRGFKKSPPRSAATKSTVGATSNVELLPSSVNWVSKGAVTSVKTQNQCGSCWAFTAVAALEGQHFVKTGKLVELSAQNLMDCVPTSQGCEGGFMDDAFAYVTKNKGIDTDASYPYKTEQDACAFKKANVGATANGFVDIQAQNETALTWAIATIGPISSAVDGSVNNFIFYKSGVFSDPDCSSSEVDHSLTIVGYGTEGGKEYYLAKNSWGTTWGENGYVKIARNANNMCGIATMASYPLK